MGFSCRDCLIARPLYNLIRHGFGRARRSARLKKIFLKKFHFTSRGKWEIVFSRRLGSRLGPLVIDRSRRPSPGSRPSKKRPRSRGSFTMHTSHPASLNELAVLMELRLAFGPGTRLWANRSREDLCYDWLYFKSRQASGGLRDFAKSLIARESTELADPKSLCDIRRRVAAVLKAYRIKRPRGKASTAPPISPEARTRKLGSLDAYPPGKAPTGVVNSIGATH